MLNIFYAFYKNIIDIPPFSNTISGYSLQVRPHKCNTTKLIYRLLITIEIVSKKINCF